MVVIRLEFVGGAGEVGKSSILLGRVALDYGVKLVSDTPEYPPYRDVDVVMLSHAHLDHCGAIPMLYRSGSPKLISTDMTIDLYDIMIHDSFKVSQINNHPIPFRKSHISKSLSSAFRTTYGETLSVHGMSVSFLDAGHIPGAAGILMEKSGKRVFYTGDTNDVETYLTRPAVYPDKVDYLIIESTYATRDHPDRKEEEKRFIQSVQEGLDNGERVIIPAFALGRAQEVIMMLYRNGFRGMYLDGMAKRISETFLRNRQYIRDPDLLERAMNATILIDGGRHRADAMSRSGVFVTTAGMMTGGPVVQYMKELYNQPSRVIFTGYLVEETPGRVLLETGIFSNDEFSVKYDNPVLKYDFSAHIGRKGLLAAIRKMSPRKIFCLHGDETGKFADELNEMGYDAEAPADGDEFDIII